MKNPQVNIEKKYLIEKQYYQENFYENILSRLAAQKVDLSSVNRTHLAKIDELHVGGAKISRSLAGMIVLEDSKVLDVGCGIGGPCRMLAEEFNCLVTGIDLSTEFIRTAKKLSQLVGFDNNPQFIIGDATNMPFDNESFDVVWTQHVQMNISDKPRFYSEIVRVLNENGTFLFYDIFKKSDQKVNYPVPWADKPEISFLTPISAIDKILMELGFKKVKMMDHSEDGIIAFEQVLAGTKNDESQKKLGLNVAMKESLKLKLPNLLESLKNGKIEILSGIYKKMP